MPKIRFGAVREDWLLNNSAASTTRFSPLWSVVLVLSAAVVAHAAPQFVTVCGQDNAPGGLNLATAIAAGGKIIIRCPAGQQEIAFTGPLNVPGIVDIDGEGKVTLRGPVAGPLFKVDIALRLAHLTVENTRTAATASTPGAGAIILGPKASIELEDVTTQNSLAAYTAQSFTARNSRFLHNGDPSAQAAFVSIINADRIELSHGTFTGNFDHPIAGGSPPAPGRPALSRSIVIEDSVFTGDVSTLLLIDARVTIRRTQFLANGVQPDKWGEAWGGCGGAITLVRSDADISESEFRGNGTNGFGGALYALGTELRIADSIFQDNTARAGGAIMFWGRRPKVNIWSTTDSPDAPRLQLHRTQFRHNAATVFGGGLLFAGSVDGNAVLFQANTSATAGGAIADWSAEPLPGPFGNVVQALLDNTDPNQADTLTLARPIMVDNVAASRGAALATRAASVTIGNGLIARNQLKTAAGGALNSTKFVALVNTTIADNPAGGLVTAPGATVRLGNSILLRNANFNCSLSGGALSDRGDNFQYPSNDCTASIAVSDPGLDDQYAPGLISAARGAGNIALCAADPQVRGVDLFGRSRLQRGRCDAGAIERPLPETLASALGLGTGPKAVPRLFWVLLVIIVLLFLLGLIWAIIWRRRRSHHRGRSAPEPDIA